MGFIFINKKAEIPCCECYGILIFIQKVMEFLLCYFSTVMAFKWFLISNIEIYYIYTFFFVFKNSEFHRWWILIALVILWRPLCFASYTPFSERISTVDSGPTGAASAPSHLMSFAVHTAVSWDSHAGVFLVFYGLMKASCHFWLMLILQNTLAIWTDVNLFASSKFKGQMGGLHNAYQFDVQDRWKLPER